jgi:hypothetical protein
LLEAEWKLVPNLRACEANDQSFSGDAQWATKKNRHKEAQKAQKTRRKPFVLFVLFCGL